MDNMRIEPTCSEMFIKLETEFIPTPTSIILLHPFASMNWHALDCRISEYRSSNLSDER